MKIALISPIEETVPPKKYGGTELVISNLAEELVIAGHDVYLLAPGDSITTAHLIPIVPNAIRTLSIAQDEQARETLKTVALAETLRQIQNLQIDVIHNHIWKCVPFLSLFSVPSVTTLHDPLVFPYRRPLFDTHKNHPYISISNSQRKPLPNLNYAATVYNGIDLNKFTLNSNAGKYLAFLGRMAPEKGPKIAIEVARKSGIPLKMAAKVDAVDKKYFAEEIEPLIDGQNIQYIGEVGPADKDEFLGDALALLAPIQWEEPFGLFMVEAMACGTPVIALRHGSVPEIVNDGETGFVVDTIDEMIAAVGKIDQIDRATCRRHIEENFSAKRMAEGYVAVYQKLIESN